MELQTLDVPRLDHFLSLLPRTLGEIDGRRKHITLHHVMEFRHPSWYVDETYDVLRAHDITLCLHDKAGPAIFEPDIGPITYVGFHGPAVATSDVTKLHRLERWAARLCDLARNERDVFAYFNNDPEGMAVLKGRELHSLVSRMR